MSEEELRLAVKNTHRHEPNPAILIARDGATANLLAPMDYPITSQCTICGERIRTRAMFVDTDWYIVHGDV